MPIPSLLQLHIEKDLTAIRREYLFGVPSSWRKRILGTLREPRDLPVAILLVNNVLLIVPAACFVIKAKSHWVGLSVLVLNYVVFLQRFLVALLHISEHRQLFSKGELLPFPTFLPVKSSQRPHRHRRQRTWRAYIPMRRNIPALQP